MDNASGSRNEDFKNIEALIPAGLTGQIRDKARDALMTATVILGMSRTDILDRIQELAKENGLPPQSARVWLLFSKEMQDQAKVVGQRVGDQGSQRTYAQNLGYGKDDKMALGLDVTFRRGLTGDGLGKSAAGDLRREMNREAGHHVDSIGGRHGVFSFDQMVDGWNGAGGGGRTAGGIGPDADEAALEADGLGVLEGETELDMEMESEDFGADDFKIDPDACERRPGESVMTPGDLKELPQLAHGGMRGVGGYEVDLHDMFRAGKSGLSGGQFKNAQRLEEKRKSVDRQVAALERKLGGFRGANAELAAFAKANPDLDKNQLRLIRKGLSDKDYLGYRIYSEHGEILNNKGKGSERIVTHTNACLLMASEDSARRFQNGMRQKVRLLSRIPDPGLEKLSFSHLERMQKPFQRLVDEFQEREKDKAGRKAGKTQDGKEPGKAKSGKNRNEPSLER
ncbi:hypothetical protein HF563_14585 [Acidithiobacillus ferridurans]|nr:hypothetical protein [Acidithiobacillus ferridurans]